MIRAVPLMHHVYLIGENSNRAALLEMISLLPRDTWRREAVTTWLRLLVLSGAYRLLKTKKHCELVEVCRTLIGDYDSVLTFSSDIRLRTRFYAFTRTKGETQFHKIVWGPERGKVRKEVDILAKLSVRQKLFQTNEVVDIVESKRHLLLTYRLLPAEFYALGQKPMDLADMVVDYSTANYLRTEVQFRELRRFDWFRNFNECFGKSDFYRYLLSFWSASDPVHVLFVHGDLGSDNVFTDGNSYLIIDWEKASDFGPQWTDRIGIYLGNNHKDLERATHFSADDLKVIYNGLKKEKIKYPEFLLGLAFYAGTNFRPGTHLINSFRYE